MDDDNLEKFYESLEDEANKFREFLYREIKQKLYEDNADYLWIEHRVKSKASVLRRCRERKLHDVRDLKDLIGIRVIVNYKDEVFKVEDIILKNFNARVIRDLKSYVPESLDKFNYDAVHLEVSPKVPYEGLDDDQWRAEIQLRTVLEHGWCEKNHRLYKENERLCEIGEFPMIQREMYGYRAQIENMDDHMMQIRDKVTSLIKAINKLNSGKTEEVEMDMESIMLYLCQESNLMDLVEIAEEVGFTSISYEEKERYTSGEFDEYDKYRLRDLLDMLKKLGIHNLICLGDLLDETIKHAEKILPKFIEHTRRHYNSTPIANPVDLLISILESKLNKGKNKYAWYGHSIGHFS